MRSRNQSGDNSSNGHFPNPKAVRSTVEEDRSMDEAKKKNNTHRKKEGEVIVSATVKRQLRPDGVNDWKKNKSKEPSKEDLIKLLSVMEGELQSAEEKRNNNVAPAKRIV